LGSPLSGEDEFRVSAHLDRETTRIGESVVLFVEAAGAGFADCEVTRFPTIKSLFIEELGARTSAGQNGGRPDLGLVSQFRYRLYPLKTGVFTIPPVEVTAGGEKKELTKPVRLFVEKGLTEPSGFAESSGFAATVPGKTFYVHQPVVFSIAVRISERESKESPIGRDLRFSLPWLDPGPSFLIMDAPPLSAESARCDLRVLELGRDVSFALSASGKDPLYRATKKFAYLPLEPGSFEFDPAFVASGSAYTLSPPLGFEVRPLPEEGRPSSFTNGVGSYQAAFEAEPRRCRVGDSVFLRFSIQGEGNIEFLEMPGFVELNGSFRVFGKRDSREKGVRHRLFEISPRSVAVKEIPALEFAWFDPGTGRYTKALWGPTPIEVLPGEGGSAGEAGRELEDDILPVIDEMPGKGGAIALFLRIVPAASFIGFLAAGLIKLRRNQLAALSASVRGKRAYSVFEKSLSSLGPDEKGDSLIVSHLLARYLSDRLCLPGKEVLTGDVRGILLSCGVAEKPAEEIGLFFRDLEKRRFGSPGPESAADLDVTALRLAERLSDSLERKEP